MAYDIAGDIRLDPRIKALLAAVPQMASSDADSRETMVAEANTPEALKGAEGFRQVMELCDTEELAPSKGLHIHTEQIVVAARWQHHQSAGDQAGDRRHGGMRLLHPRGRDDDAVLLRRDVPGLGQGDRCERGGRGHGGLPQCADALVGARGGTVPSRPQ